MFEGPIKKPNFEDRGQSPVLRSFRWTDLVAKLAATRELRDEIARVEGGFGAFADARRETVRVSGEEPKGAVNHDALSRGKAGGVSLGQPAGDAGQGDREKE